MKKRKAVRCILSLMLAVMLVATGIPGTAFTAAQEVLADETDDMTEKEELVDKILTLLDDIKALNEEDYTEESWEKLQERVNQLTGYTWDQKDTILTYPEAILNSVLQGLQELVDELVKKPSKAEELTDQLLTLFDEARALKEEDYTEESWKAFKTELDRYDSYTWENKETIMGYPESVLERAIDMVNQLVGSLVKKPSGVTSKDRNC